MNKIMSAKNTMVFDTIQSIKEKIIEIEEEIGNKTLQVVTNRGNTTTNNIIIGDCVYGADGSINNNDGGELLLQGEVKCESKLTVSNRHIYGKTFFIETEDNYVIPEPDDTNIEMTVVFKGDITGKKITLPSTIREGYKINIANIGTVGVTIGVDLSGPLLIFCSLGGVFSGSYPVQGKQSVPLKLNKGIQIIHISNGFLIFSETTTASDLFINTIKNLNPLFTNYCGYQNIEQIHQYGKINSPPTMTGTYTFPTAFSSIPIVMLTGQSGAQLITQLTNITETNFQWKTNVVPTALYWSAIGTLEQTF